MARESIQFQLNDELRKIDNVSPTMTVLEYLRTIENQCGTKEGCGEGDCGACTVVVGEPNDGRMVYRAVNACIQFLPTLDGKQIITVEYLARPDGSLHPVQQVIAENHGSQCGFCTPGFVMSLYALGRTDQSPTRKTIDDAIAGNLCRCTGYGTIIKAAQCVGDSVMKDHIAAKEVETAIGLLTIRDGGSLYYEHQDQKFFAPETSDEFAGLYEQYPEATILSGGTDVGLWVTKLGRRLSTIIYLGAVAELDRIEVSDNNVSIWAGCRQTDAMAVIAEQYEDFGELLRRFGSTQVRNAGTFCGNIANGSPIGDCPPALLALGAKITLRKGKSRREINLEEFFVDYGVQDSQPGEFVELITFPVADPGWQFKAYKISKRFDQDISAVCGAFNVQLLNGQVEDIRIAFGGMAATPKRAAGLEKSLIGEPWTENTVDTVLGRLEVDFTPISDMRSSADYRMRVAKNLVRKFFLETTGVSAPLRVVDGEALIHAT